MGDKLKLVEAVKSLMEYRKHLSTCHYERTDFCTCGMREVAIEARKALIDFETSKAEKLIKGGE